VNASRSRTIAVAALVGVLVVVVWWMVLYSPTKSDASDVGRETAEAERETQRLEADLKRLEDLEARGSQTQADLARLQQAMPEQAELATFIAAANEIGRAAGINWLSVAPTEPTATGSVGTIQLSMQVEGGYFEVLDYLRRLEDLSRLVVVDSITVNSGAASGSTDAATPPGSDSSPATGAPTLSATLTGRMFTQPAAAAAAVPGSGETTTTVATEQQTSPPAED
jgi:type IV pilus assembly protein PilO